MKNNKRIFDVLVLGATAFTGKLAVHYLSRSLPPNIQWAIAGRNTKKLAELKNEIASHAHLPSHEFTFDHLDREAVRDAVAQARIVLNFAGPFARYGENVVAACADLGTHYLDITGETLWIRDMIDRYEKTAKKTGAILIPFSGFDSVPSDLGVTEVLHRAKEKNRDSKITRVVSLFSVRGGVNGGTYATMLDMFSRDETERLNDPFLLVPKEYRSQFRFNSSKTPVFIPEEKRTAPPFFMAPINSKVVYRSQSLRKSQGASTEPAFEYQELMKLPKPFSRIQSWCVVASMKLLEKVGKFPKGRQLLKTIGPKPGEGPSEKMRESGFFRTKFFAYQNSKLIAKCELFFPGDPGNKATVTFICESALCLALDPERFSAIPGGFWTPTTALGGALKDRLTNAGLVIS